MKEKQIKRIAGLLSFLLAFAAFAGCGGGGSSLPSETESSADTSSDDADTESPADSSAEAPEESPWTEEPVVKSVFFSDFGNDESIGENWSLVNYGWGQNGVSYSNAGFTRSPGVVSKQGATGGIIVLNSYGNYYKDPSKRGQGACLISNRLFGPGLYEIRMKVVPRFGPCSTAWSYYTNSYAIDTATGPVYGHNTAENIQYHEIDIECPRIGKGFNGWGGVAYEEYYQDAENLGEDGLGRVVNHSTGVSVTTESPYNDGQWHTFAFEWRTQGYDYDPSEGENPGAIIWYMDGKEVARTAKNTPYYPDQLWIGNWYPDNATDWLGVADFDEAYMYIDWVRITEYEDEYRTVGKDGEVIKPDLGGCVLFSSSPGGNTNWAANLPINNYISNGSFSYGDGTEAIGWDLTDATRTSDGLRLEGGRATQEISAQYAGYTFFLEGTGVLSSGVSGRIYVENISGEYAPGSNDNRKMEERVIGKSDAIVFGTSEETLSMEFTLPEGTNNLRVVVESDDGSIFVLKNLRMHLKSDM